MRAFQIIKISHGRRFVQPIPDKEFCAVNIHPDYHPENIVSVSRNICHSITIETAVRSELPDSSYKWHGVAVLVAYAKPALECLQTPISDVRMRQKAVRTAQFLSSV
jgi:hypothetical protein